MERIKQTYRNHVTAFRETYGVRSSLAALLDVLTVFGGAILALASTGSFETIIGVFLVVIGLGGLLKRIYGRVA